MNNDQLDKALEAQRNEDRADKGRIKRRMEKALETLNDSSSTKRQRDDALNAWRKDTADLDVLDRRLNRN